MKIASLSLLLFQTFISHAQTVSDNLNWVSGSSVTSVGSPSFNFCNGQVSYTVSSSIGFKNISTAGNPNYTTGMITPAYIYAPSPSIPITITFSQPVCNLRIRFSDLDGGQNEYLSAISTPYTSLMGVVGVFSNPGNSTTVNSSMDDARGWVEWTGPITNLSFNYNRPGPGCGLIIDSIRFECCCQNPPNPGTNNTWSICSQGAPADLFPLLGPGASTSNGTWTNPSGAVVTMPYNPLTMNPGVYTYSVGSNGCSSSATITVTEINPTVSVVPTAATCNGMSNGSAALTVANATMYSLNGGPNTPVPSPFVINGLAAGTYQVVVYHVSGCTDSESFTINEPPVSQPQITSLSPDLVLCTTGVSTLTATGSGGPLPYTFTWFANGGILGTGSSINVTTSQTTQYGVILTDGCGSISDTAFMTIVVSPPPNPGTDNTWSICSQGAPADLFPLLGPGVSTSNGTWTNPSGAVVTMPYNPLTMNPGVYTYSVDSNGCSSSATITVTEINPTVSVVPTAATCNGMSNGSAALTVANATMYSLNGGPNTPVPSPFVINGLAAGTYQVVVYHVSGCTDSESFTINEPPVSQPQITSLSPDLVLCATGVSTLTATGSGGPLPYTFTWFANGGILGTGSSINVTTSQTTQYGVILTDGCGSISDTAFMTIVVSPPPNPGTDNTWSICSQGAPADLFPLLGPGASTSNGTWTNPSGAVVTMPYNPLTMNPGVYTYSVDSNGCSSSATITVTEINPTVSVVPTDATCNGMSNGSAALTVTDATIYSLNGGPNAPASSSFVINGLAAGTYQVVVYHVSGCTDSESFTINEPPVSQPLITSLSPDLVLCTTGVSTLTATGSGGPLPYTFTWFANGGILGTGSSINVTTSQTTQYGVILTDGCGSISDTAFMTILVPQPLIPILTPDDTIGCSPHQVVFSNNTSGLGNIVTSTINFGDGTPVITTLGLDTCSHTYESEGTYTVLITSTSDKGCVYSNTFENIIVMDGPTAEFHISPNPTTFFQTHILLDNTSSTDVVSYNWFMPGALPNQSSSENVSIDLPEGIVGNYPVTLVVTDEFGCIDSVTKIVQVLSDVVVYAPNTFTPDGDEFNQTWFLYIDGIDIQQFHLLVFNRWGEVIWESNDPNGRWDGTYHGALVPNGLYNWILETKELISDKKYTFNGYINVMR